MIETLKNYISTCPLLSDGKIKINYIDLSPRVPVAYAVEPLPGDPWVKRYVDGGGVKQFNFTFTTVKNFNMEDLLLIEGSQFTVDFINWIDEQYMKRNLPDIGKPLSISVLSNGF